MAKLLLIDFYISNSSINLRYIVNYETKAGSPVLATNLRPCIRAVRIKKYARIGIFMKHEREISGIFLPNESIGTRVLSAN